MSAGCRCYSEPAAPPNNSLLSISVHSKRTNERETFYKATHTACRYVLGLPSARLIQETVQSCKAFDWTGGSQAETVHRQKVE